MPAHREFPGTAPSLTLADTTPWVRMHPQPQGWGDYPAASRRPWAVFRWGIEGLRATYLPHRQHQLNP
jgi:hypothetical protein